MATSIVLETSLGSIEIALFSDKAPQTVDNILQYVDAGHYSGTLFHRVIPGFMAQGGGYDGNYEKKPTRAPIKNEADNGLRNRRGTVAMARTSIVDSATSQFFINVADNAFLDHSGKTDSAWGYAVFGEVVKGMDVVEKMIACKTGAAGPFAKDAPLEPIVILSARRA